MLSFADQNKSKMYYTFWMVVGFDKKHWKCTQKFSNIIKYSMIILTADTQKRD